QALSKGVKSNSRRSIMKRLMAKKNLLWIAELLVFTLGLSACGGAAIKSHSQEADAAAGGDTVKIGTIVPVSGVYAALGEDVRDGMKLYFERVDWEAGGKTIELSEEDTEADPQVALRKTRKLMDQDNVDFLTGAISTAVAYAVRDEVNEKK